MGCSTHRVPSWSNVAIRSAVGTNFGLPWSVVSFTKVMIACLARPSFHEGSGSPDVADCAREEMGMSDGEKAGSTANAESTARRLILKRCEYDFISGASRLPAMPEPTVAFGVRMGTPLGCCLCKFRLAALE